MEDERKEECNTKDAPPLAVASQLGGAGEKGQVRGFC